MKCMWCWYWHHVMLKALSMAQLHLFAQDHANEVQHDCSYDATGTSIGITSR